MNRSEAAKKIAALEAELRLLRQPLSQRLATLSQAWRLTPKESEVLGLLSEAYSNKDIGVRLGIANGTVEIHVSRIMSKSRCYSRAQVIVAAHTGVVP